MCYLAVAITALVRTYSMVTNSGKLDQNEVPTNQLDPMLIERNLYDCKKNQDVKNLHFNVFLGLSCYQFIVSMYLNVRKHIVM